MSFHLTNTTCEVNYNWITLVVTKSEWVRGDHKFVMRSSWTIPFVFQYMAKTGISMLRHSAHSCIWNWIDKKLRWVPMDNTTVEFNYCESNFVFWTRISKSRVWDIRGNIFTMNCMIKWESSTHALNVWFNLMCATRKNSLTFKTEL